MSELRPDKNDKTKKKKKVNKQKAEQKRRSQSCLRGGDSLDSAHSESNFEAPDNKRYYFLRADATSEGGGLGLFTEAVLTTSVYDHNLAEILEVHKKAAIQVT